MTIGLILTALGLGIRHGVDWDHIAAIADLSSSAASRRRGFVLSVVYALGHAVVVVILGLVAIAFGATLPKGADLWLGRVVGATLVLLGLWILVELLRKGRDFRLRSRWLLVFSGTFAGLRRVRDARSRRRLTLEHAHEHEHSDPDGSDVEDRPGGGLHDDSQAHDHPHQLTSDSIGLRSPDPEASPLVAAGKSRRSLARQTIAEWGSAARSHRHAHRHRHELALAETQASTAGNGTAAGIGVLHGIGVVSPTQIAVFVASTSVVGVGAGFALLVAWVVGLVVANSALAGLAAFGLLEAERNFALYATIAVFVGLASTAMGLLLIMGIDALPALT